MRIPFDGSDPEVADDAYVSRTAVLSGDVAVASGASVWPLVSLRGDRGPVAVGEETNVQEFTTLHGAELGDRVSVGHGAVVDFATVADDVLVGMQSSVLQGATVESNCLVAANAVVPSGTTVPEGHLAYGTPAETRPLTDGQREQISQVHEHYATLSKRFARAETDAYRVPPERGSEE
ncbi:gamma carbonic anhydrase family protein [Halorubrum salipaludis]|uniref:Gamma carbonic anhydrase family protein n=1 Tax=Halorubrum salipaludis TaxID=2032630 RepID=A0A2A2FDV2_9EURY|nr:gamma carbonic anhydrase family protein [Halorubrum salipaludis]PAU83020.1 gamma carbonic anhydrase family protein [Halorubrum salipaludis]